MSNGSGAKNKAYRKKIDEMLKSGNWRKAIATEIKDVRRVAKKFGDPKLYNEAIKEQLAYFKCLEKNGLLPKG